MKQKYIGIIIIAIGVLLCAFVFMAKLRDDSYVNDYIMKNDTCYLSDGTCLHNRDYTLYIFGWIMSAALIILGSYLIFFSKVEEKIVEEQKQISHALRDAKELEKKKDEFHAFFSGFTEDEQKILKAIHAQEGIKQSTLRFKTGLSKTTLSLMLKSLEERKMVSRKASGKTNEVFLVKKF